MRNPGHFSLLRTYRTYDLKLVLTLNFSNVHLPL